MVKQKDLNMLSWEFHDTSFNLLMQKRIHKVLLICSNYDAFMLEEDGRIDEQIFNEYVSLNLRYPPIFIQVKSAKEAFRVLETDSVDLVITMLNIGEIDTFKLAKIIKEKHPEKPIVVLTHFSREVSLRFENEDLSAIDYVFCWLGNADILLAIIKLIEDKMNAEYDIEHVGVQAILLVEDSIRFISSYLPNLYKIIFKQSKEFMREGLNEHHKMLRMRGRPKVLLARTYDEAIDLYEKYKLNVLGIISDVSFKVNNKRDKETKAGLELCKKIRSDDEHMPLLFQSSDKSTEIFARELNAGFIHKYSKNLSIELRNFIIRHFAFGEFIFRDPVTLKEITRAEDLQALQQKILTIPDECMEYHTRRNHFSKWLNARALFPIARMFKYVSFDDFDNTGDMRQYLFNAISSFRFSKGRGIIAKFEKGSFDEYLMFSRIGEGSIGGKARGLAFVNSILKKYKLYNKYDNVIITIPRTVVLSTDIFDEFMEANDLYKIGLSEMSDDEILNHFINARLPGRLHQDLYSFISVANNPIAIRSSSKLEDSHYQPFAGVYSTYMIPNSPLSDTSQTMKLLTNAIKSVYASVYFKSSKAYMTATSNVIDEEKMGIILQEICGRQYDNMFYPTFSGVARSINFYPIAPEKPDEGIVNIAFGLGKLIVDGGLSLRFSPKYPKKLLQLSSPEMALRDTQKYFYALDMSAESFVPSTDDGINLIKTYIRNIKDECQLKYVASTYDLQNHIIRNGVEYPGKKIISFSNILQHNTFPLTSILNDLLEMGEREMNNPIEIEFAVNLNTPVDYPKVFNFLQIRPIVDNGQNIDIELKDIPHEKTIIYSESAMGNGFIEGISDIVYVKPDSFNPAATKDMAVLIEQVNSKFNKENKNYILVGPGRWGSSDPWLGIPIKWPQISRARVIVESGLKNFRVDPSQGTHFFQNLTSFRVGYLTINPYINEGFIDLAFLSEFKSCYEDNYIRHVCFDSPLRVLIDGKTNRGVVFKP